MHTVEVGERMAENRIASGHPVEPREILRHGQASGECIPNRCPLCLRTGPPSERIDDDQGASGCALRPQLQADQPVIEMEGRPQSVLFIQLERREERPACRLVNGELKIVGRNGMKPELKAMRQFHVVIPLPSAPSTLPG